MFCHSDAEFDENKLNTLKKVIYIYIFTSDETDIHL